MVLAVTCVSAHSNAECFWTAHNCRAYSGRQMQQWAAEPGEQDPRIHYSWTYDSGAGSWSGEPVYPTIVDYGGWGREEDYGRYYYWNRNRVWRDYDYYDYYPPKIVSGDAGYFYMIKNEKMGPLYKKGCWNGYCEWYNIHDPHDYIRWTDLQNAIEDETGNHSTKMCYYENIGYYYC